MAIVGSSLGPAIDDDAVVAVEFVAFAMTVFCDDRVGHEFECNGFGPCDVATV